MNFEIKLCSNLTHGEQRELLNLILGSSMTMEVKAVTHTMQWLAFHSDTKITHVIKQLQKVWSLGRAALKSNMAMHSLQLRRYCCCSSTLTMGADREERGRGWKEWTCRKTGKHSRHHPPPPAPPPTPLSLVWQRWSAVRLEELLEHGLMALMA